MFVNLILEEEKKRKSTGKYTGSSSRIRETQVLDPSDIVVVLTHIRHLNILQKQFVNDVMKAEVIIETRWKQPLPEATKKHSSTDLEMTWNPDVYIANSFGRVTTTSIVSQQTVKDGLFFVERKRFKGRFIQRPNWYLFPFDTQKFLIILAAMNKQFPIDLKAKPRRTKPLQEIISSLDAQQYRIGKLEYQTQEAPMLSTSIEAYVMVYRNGLVYISYIFYDFNLGCMSLLPYALPDSYCDFRVIFCISLLLLFIGSETKMRSLRPASNHYTFMELWHRTSVHAARAFPVHLCWRILCRFSSLVYFRRLCQFSEEAVCCFWLKCWPDVCRL